MAGALQKVSNGGMFQTTVPAPAGDAKLVAALPENHAPLTAPSGLLVEIATGLAAGSDLGQLLMRFLEPLMRLAGAQAGAVRVLSDAGDELQLISSLGLPDELCSQSNAVDRHCGHCGEALDGQPMVWATDLRDCSARSHSTFFEKDGLRLLAVPLKHRGRTLGVYNLFYKDAAQPPPHFEPILRSIGELLGLALNNARLENERLRHTLMSERQMMAAEVHDSLAQSLAFVKMRMPLLHDAMRSHDDVRAQQYYDDVRGAMTQAHASLRGILTHFRSPMDPLGLLHALGASAEAFRRSSGTELQFTNAVPQLALPPEQESQVFHIVQEALNNVERHAGALHAWLHIERAQPGMLQITIEDDGAGMPVPAAGNSHYGMEIMAERARRLGAALEVTPRAGGGTTVRLEFAYAGQEK
jgi:two-component system nitrate/nitrite sensor histidine kinase NarX